MEFCRYEKKGHVAYVTITRPEVMNAIHPPASQELDQVWNDFAADDDAWVAVLTGEGQRAFSAGNDLKYTAEMSKLPADQRPKMFFPASGFGGITSRHDLFKPIIARVNGFALGGGLEMALACDIIIAAEHAELGLPEPRRGLIAGANGVHRLPRQIPLHTALGFMLTGRHIPAKRAYELGLVNEVVPYEQLDATVDAYVEDILKCAPISVRATKEAALRGLEVSLPEAEKGKYEWELKRRTSEDSIEGPRAFAEKRTPNWQGR
ncbi:MAG: enoyl-CoA hydratase/isomerase family protein [Dehalococcoidia bacterium]|nr:enoyl-CoA hydratase/isomerase family protein [Dehalococcoidia bacterium]